MCDTMHDIYSSTFDLRPGRGIRTFLLPCFMSLKMHALKTKAVMGVAYLSCYKVWKVYRVDRRILSTER